jgi:hypothetical protein
MFSHMGQCNPRVVDINELASGDNSDINAKVNVELCGDLEFSKYHSNYPPHKIYDCGNMTHSEIIPRFNRVATISFFNPY